MMQEIGRIPKPSADGARSVFTIAQGNETIVIENGLSAVLLCAWGRQATADDYDFAVPGSSLFTIPMLGGQSRLNVTIDYPGAVVAADVQAIVWASGCQWPPFVAPIV